MMNFRLAVALRAGVCAVQTDGVVRDSCPCDFICTIFNEHNLKIKIVSHTFISLSQEDFIIFIFLPTL